MNLHAIVRSAITVVKPDTPTTIYYAVGQENIKGVVTPLYEEPQAITAQWQPIDTERLDHLERVSSTEVTEQVFLYSSKTMPVSGIKRVPIARTGDILKRDDLFYLVTDVIEDWSDVGLAVGWVNVAVVLQTKPPEGIV